MELNTLEPAAEAFLQLRHPVTGVPLVDVVKGENGEETKTPVGIFLYGQDSPQYKARQRLLLDKQIEINASTKRGGRPKIDGETIETESLQTLVACMKGFQAIELDGEKLEYTPANAERLIKRFGWIEEQVDQGIVDRANFLKGSSKK